ncbi:glycoside hydrolase family 25 protein [Streptococcus dentasini]
MRKRIKPIVVYVFLALVGLFLSIASVVIMNARSTALQTARKNIPSASSTSLPKTSASSSSDNELKLKPIVDISGWQLPKQIDYDALSKNISGAIVRVYGGSQISKDSNAAHSTGVDKSFKTHIKEFQKRDIPVAVYSYALGRSEKEMREEAKIFYNSASPYKPTYYWIDVEEDTMRNMDRGVEAFRAELKRLGAEHVGIYIGTYFMTEQEISVKKFDAVWLPTYGSDSGYYEAQPQTDVDYDLHQYTSQGSLPGFDDILDLNQINPNKDARKTFEKLFGKIKE